MSFKDISYLEFGRHIVQRSKNICAILVEGIMRNNFINFIHILVSGSGGDVV